MSESIDRELTGLAAETAREAGTFLVALQELASGGRPDTALPLLLLATTQLQATGARLGAMVDVVPHEQFEADTGPEANIEGVRHGLHDLLAGVDDYVEVEDPVVSGEVVHGLISDDLTQVASDLTHGLHHWEAGRHQEALWWWQFSYLSTWGERLVAAIRALHSLLAHARLDADEETVMEAEMAALHAEPAEVPRP
ncbi:DUF5063 domain-containing protein [Ornithinimicrobium faecis]|uniref:DUF5063 domain-containing protein n=1 Tax=Ornithinimicrobium faecis TaxID=2934158 RepID=A0ABY4YSB5_9MICO|nr:MULTISPECIES: DUF5063 domain-containing protein [unclassified Ornithinimicrobium]USQ79657.1 DUF5063 domain-containing protein [Ornithinimicrobium sp. HY1793]